jgi:eukaryotic-like serine/threonine-protein kinase
MPLVSGTSLGPYEIIAPIGAGGMGEVYRAHDTRLNRDVAVKVLPAHLASDAASLARFEREAKAVAALSHPNILVLFDIGSRDGITWAVTELLEGETLRSRLDGGPLPWRKAAEIGAAVAQGLAAAHAKGIVHRDIKPANIFLTSDGRVKILDFGLASEVPFLKPHEKTATNVGPGPETLSGTLPYMSPEQVRGEETGIQSDIFSLGIVLYEAAAGRRPFAGTSAGELMAEILKEDPPPITASGRQVPPELERVVERCLAKNALQRFHSADDLAFALTSMMGTSQQGLEAQPAAPPRARKRVLQWVIAAVAIVVLIGVGAFYYLRMAQRRGIDSLAVMPFVNASPSPEADYLSDGITESLIGSLSQFPNLKVMSRSAVFRFKGKETDARAVGRELGVRAVLTGRVTQHGGDLAVSTELVNVDDDSVLWGEQYNRSLMDALAVQNDIAHQIVDKLKVKLSAQQLTEMQRYQTANPEAYQLYLKGRYYAGKFDPVNLNKGRDYFRQAIALDPSFALAYDGLSFYYALLLDWFEAENDAGPKSLEAALKALELDPNLVEAHVELGTAHLFYDFDWPAAERELKRAMELNPNYAPGHEYHGWYLISMGRNAESLAAMRRAQQLDPLSAEIDYETGWFLLFSRRYAEALVELDKALELDPDLWVAYFFKGQAYEQMRRWPEALAALKKSEQILGDNPSPPLAEEARVYALSGRRGEAAQTLDRLLALSKKTQVSKYAIATVYASLGDKDRAFATLDQAYDEHSFLLGFLKVDPALDPLRADPRFRNLLGKMKLQ